MSTICFDHVVSGFDNNERERDITLWLSDIFKKYGPCLRDLRLTMGLSAAETFKLMCGHDNAYWFFEKWVIPKSCAIFDPTFGHDHIKIVWEISNDFSGVKVDLGVKQSIPEIKKVIYNDPATIIFWSNHTKTVVQCQKGDDYDPEKGLVMAIAKKALGNTSRKLNDVLHKWEKKEEPSVPLSCCHCKYGGLTLSKEPCKSCDISFSNWEAEE